MVTILLVVSVAGVTYAYWSGAGGGAGSGTTGTTVAVTLSPGTPVADLYPGGRANVAVTASNPNTSPVQIGSLELDPGQGTGGFAVDAGHTGCALAALSFTTQTNGGAGWNVPAKVGAVNGTLSITLSNALAMAAAAANACQGASISIYLKAAP
jgi:hypothetical protein